MGGYRGMSSYWNKYGSLQFVFGVDSDVSGYM